MRIGMIGFGGVGKAFIQLIMEKENLLSHNNLSVSVNYILSSRGGVHDPNGISSYGIIKHVNEGLSLASYPKGGSSELDYDTMIKNGDIDVLIELTPTNKQTGEPGLTYIRTALSNGINVVTGNKGPILLAYQELKQLAQKNHVQLAVGCTAGGALPSINGGLIDLAGSDILSIEGILNGTSNYIIQNMTKENMTYNQALEAAQLIGIAETDPSLDVEGWDTALKLLIITNILTNQSKTLDDVKVEGITNLTLDDINSAIAEGKKYKLIGKAKISGADINLQVKLEKIEENDILYHTDGKNKAVRYVSDTLGELVIFGGASGVKPAAASILRDLINISKGYRFS